MKRTRSSPIIPSLLFSASMLLPAFNASAGPVEKNPLAGKGTVQVAEAHPMYLGTINTGIKTNDSYTDGNFSIVAPIWSTLGAESTLSGGVLFLEPYISYGEGGEVAASLGLGYRHLFGTQSVSALTNHDGHQAGFFEEGAFIGANLFVDMLETEANNQFWQLGVGLEAGTRYVEVRGNYYIPLSDKQLAEEFRTREQFQTTSSQVQQTGFPLGDPFATGNSIVQNTGFTTIQTTTTRTTTIERLFRRYEEGMEGWDAELALLIPGLDKYFDLRLIGGYYSFDNQPFGPQEGGTGNVEGWKAGVEVRPVPAVILSGTWYEDERLTGADWTAGVQLQLPFEMGDLGDGKGFWDRIGDSFTPRRRHLVERLAEPVHRQNAAVKIANSVEEEETTTSTKVQRVTKVLSRGQGQIVLADDIVFVNNGEAVGNGIQAGDTLANGANGTAEHPFNSIVEGATTASTNANSGGTTWTVYTQGTATPYTGVATVTGSTKFISSFTPIVSATGGVFGGNTARPVLSGNFNATTGMPFLQVTGYEIHGGASTGISALNVRNLIVSDNHFVLTGSRGVQATAAAIPTAQALITGNRFTGSTNLVPAIEFAAGGTTVLTATATQNELDGAFHTGILTRTVANGNITALVQGNILAGTYTSGLSAESSTGLNITMNTLDNTLSGTFTTGIRYSSASNSPTRGVQGTASGNVLSGTFTNGVLITATGSSFANVTVTGNELSGTFTNGIFADKHISSAVTVDTLGNTLSGTFATTGIQYFADGGVADGFLGGSVRNNVLSGTFTLDGILLQAVNAVMVTQNEEGNTPVVVEGNELSGSFTNGIRVRRGAFFASTGDITTSILGNELSGNFSGDGIFLSSDGTAVGGTHATIADNVLTGDFGRGIVMSGVNGAPINAVVRNNLLAEGSTYATYGIFASRSISTFGVTTITEFNGNIIRGTSQTGMRFVEGAGVMTVNGTLDPASSNEVSNEDGNKLEFQSSPSGQFYLNGNLITLPTTVP